MLRHIVSLGENAMGIIIANVVFFFNSILASSSLWKTPCMNFSVPLNVRGIHVTSFQS